MATVGWVHSPDGRGTLNIIWSCVATVILCCWSSLCVNVPTRGEGQFWQLCDKFNLACVGILGPEWLFALALGQYESACRSVKEFHSAGFHSWTMRHAFYADMGGFLLQVPAQQAPSSLPAALKPQPLTFPLDAKQLCYLVRHGYVEFPTIEKEEVAETDRLGRNITIFQVIWFSVNSIARAVQHLPLTTLELTTLAFIPCMIASSFCWYHKPSSIGRATMLKCETPLAKILTSAGDDAQKPYRKTPLDFVSREEWSISLFWAYGLNVSRKMHLRVFARQISSRPITRIPNDNWPQLDVKGGLLLVLVSVLYSAIFVSGWNSPFPTRIECILWRTSSLGTMAFTIILAIVEVLGFRLYMPHRQRFPETKASANNMEALNAETMPDAEASLQLPRYTQQNIPDKAHRLVQGWRNPSPDNDPALEVPLRVLIPTATLCASYSVFRAYCLVEDVLGLRALPPSAFQTVNWPNWFPHI